MPIINNYYNIMSSETKNSNVLYNTYCMHLDTIYKKNCRVKLVQ